MKANKNDKENKPRCLGRMTDAEYEKMWAGEKKKYARRKRNILRRLTEDEYKNLPYGNKGFYEQFKKTDTKESK